MYVLSLHQPNIIAYLILMYIDGVAVARVVQLKTLVAHPRFERRSPKQIMSIGTLMTRESLSLLVDSVSL